MVEIEIECEVCGKVGGCKYNTVLARWECEACERVTKKRIREKNRLARRRERETR